MRSLLVAVALAINLLGTPVMATEEPPFTVRLTRGEFAVRDYPPLVVAEVSVTGGRQDAAGKGFRLLAGYIFGDNTAKQKIAMTAPVIQSPDGETIPMTAPVLQTGKDGTWVIRFIMPRGSTLGTLPRPNNPVVRLRALAAVRVAVVRFSGLARQDDVAAKTFALSRFVTAQRLQAVGPPALAQYDPPWTLWFLRRNEIMIPLAFAAAVAK